MGAGRELHEMDVYWKAGGENVEGGPWGVE